MFCCQKSNMQSFTFYYTVTPTGSRHCLLACAFPFLLLSLCPRGEESPKKRVLRKQGLQGAWGHAVRAAVAAGGGHCRHKLRPRPVGRFPSDAGGAARGLPEQAPCRPAVGAQPVLGGAGAEVPKEGEGEPAGGGHWLLSLNCQCRRELRRPWIGFTLCHQPKFKP